MAVKVTVEVDSNTQATQVVEIYDGMGELKSSVVINPGDAAQTLSFDPDAGEGCQIYDQVADDGSEETPGEDDPTAMGLLHSGLTRQMF